jgi:hypothetical protein
MTAAGTPARGCAFVRNRAAIGSVAPDSCDIAARNRGDEFCVVFADAENSLAIEHPERLRASSARADVSQDCTRTFWE